MKSNGRILLAAACCLILILSAGCAALSTTTAKQESLEERVKNYMQAQIDGKWDRAYAFLDSSSHEREARESYINRPRKQSYRTFVIDEIKVIPSGDQATVKIKTDISYKGYNFKGASHIQHWVKERGDWFVKWSGNTASLPHQQKQQ